MRRARTIKLLLVMIPVGFILTTCVVAALAQYPSWFFRNAQCVFATNVFAQEIPDTAGEYLMEYGLMFYRDQVPDTNWRYPDGWWCTRR